MNKLKRNTKVLIGISSFLLVLMIIGIVNTSSKGTFSADSECDTRSIANCTSDNRCEIGPNGQCRSKTCPTGSYLDNGECKICPAGYYCPGDTEKYSCPENTTSSEGISDEKECSITLFCSGRSIANCRSEDGCVWSRNSCYEKSGSFTVRFNRAEDTELFEECKTDEAGFLETNCTGHNNICNEWSYNTYSSGGTPQISFGNNSEIMNKGKFDRDTDLYCVAGTSIHEGGYSSDDPTQSNVVVTFKSSRGNSLGLDHETCTADDEGLLNWDCISPFQEKCGTSWSLQQFDGTNYNQPENYTYNSLPEAKFSNNTTLYCIATNLSTGGDDPNVNENPKTGDVLIIIVWVIGISSIGYSIWYLKKMKISNK